MFIFILGHNVLGPVAVSVLNLNNASAICANVHLSPVATTIASSLVNGPPKRGDRTGDQCPISDLRQPNRPRPKLPSDGHGFETVPLCKFAL
ncbi:MAG: hypothetical protein N3A53_01600 [Verrucomicrobiae bacterium]|nr:hypothetical protein [Verrucomicrobiae bacterium]